MRELIKNIWTALSVFGLLGFTLISTQLAHANHFGFSLSGATGAQNPSQVLVTVVDEISRRPLSGAKVAFSDELEFSSDPTAVQFVTSHTGAVQFNWRGTRSKSVTVIREGYTTFSVVGVQSEQLTVYMKPLPEASSEVVFSGSLEGWKKPFSSQSIYGGLVFKSASVFDVLTFPVASFISPVADTVEILGPQKIPSNFVLPEQEISLVFTRILLNKPEYSLSLPKNQTYRLAAIQGEMRVTDVVSAIQGGFGKVSAEVLNQVKISKIGVSGPVDAVRDTRVEMDASVELAPKHQVTLTPPGFRADVIAVSFTDFLGDRSTLIPTDFKTAATEERPSPLREVSLLGPSRPFGRSQEVLALAVGGMGKQISAVWVPQAGSRVRPGAFLTVDPFPESEQLPERVKIKAPAQGISMATFDGSVAGREDFTVWRVYVLPSAGEIQVPTRMLPSNAKIQSFAVTGLEFREPISEKTFDGKTALFKLQRFTRSSSQSLKTAP